MNKIEIKKTPESNYFPYTYVSIELKGETVHIALKIQNNYIKIEFIADDPPHKYEVGDSKNNIKIINPLDLTNDKNHNELKYYYKSEGNGAEKEFILEFEIQIKHLQIHDGLYKLKFKGENKSINIHPEDPEEGIIIFEPPTKKQKHKKP